MLRAIPNLNFGQNCDINTFITFLHNFLLGAPWKCSQGAENQLLQKTSWKCNSCVKITKNRISKYSPSRKTRKNRRYRFCGIADISRNSFRPVEIMIVETYLTDMDIFWGKKFWHIRQTDENILKKPISIILRQHGTVLKLTAPGRFSRKLFFGERILFCGFTKNTFLPVSQVKFSSDVF